MAILILSVRTGTPPNLIDQVMSIGRSQYHSRSYFQCQMYGSRGVMIPKMPALGLLLEYPVFEAYNRKITAANERIHEPNDPEYRHPIDFEPHREIIEEFKREHIYSRMRTIEGKQAV
jgi:tRNA pseudouridine38-40 synthase